MAEEWAGLPLWDLQMKVLNHVQGSPRCKSKQLHAGLHREGQGPGCSCAWQAWCGPSRAGHLDLGLCWHTCAVTITRLGS